MCFPKQVLSSLLALSLVFSLISCKKDDPAVQESPIFTFFEETAIQIDTVEQAADTWDYGFAFSPLQSGRIAQLGMKLPVSGSFKVTLWDLNGATPAALVSQNISAQTAHQSITQDITGVQVENGKKYGISILANTFYRITKTDGSAFTYPKTIGNILVEGFHESVNTNGLASFPSETNDTRLAPCVDVIFIAD
ncbi:MAG: hypothetical protein JNN28_11450 [Saprospiraceae bacterium]|nr:hypothetical protein [Saprospiraceae bacterium]